MIYLSAQPDRPYFLWQLELQLFNFLSSGIPPERIRVLVGYDPQKGLNPAFGDFMKKYEGSVFAYPDTRKRKKYASSIRPHLLAKHFREYPEMERETLFYHDSDVLFTRCPDWKELEEDAVWYASDTRSYLDSRYIRRHMSEEVFAGMCQVLSVDTTRVERHDDSAGGAQYILKRCTATFWEKAETDCEDLYLYLSSRQKSGAIGKEFQVWCTDMWVVGWNAWLAGRELAVHPLLDFCWAASPATDLLRKNILHYTGCGQDGSDVFDKKRYQTHSPFYADLSQVSKRTCSAFVIDTIRAYRQRIDRFRLELTDTLFLFLQRENAPDTETGTETMRRYYLRYCRVKTGHCAAGRLADVFPESGSATVFPIPAGWIFPSGELAAMMADRKKRTAFCVVYPVRLYRVDPLGKHIFASVLDDAYLEENRGKTVADPILRSVQIYRGRPDGTTEHTGKIFIAYGLPY